MELQKLSTDFDEFFGGVRRGPRKKKLDFDGDADCHFQIIPDYLR